METQPRAATLPAQDTVLSTAPAREPTVKSSLSKTGAARRHRSSRGQTNGAEVRVAELCGDPRRETDFKTQRCQRTRPLTELDRDCARALVVGGPGGSKSRQARVGRGVCSGAAIPDRPSPDLRAIARPDGSTKCVRTLISEQVRAGGLAGGSLATVSQGPTGPLGAGGLQSWFCPRPQFQLPEAPP